MRDLGTRTKLLFSLAIVLFGLFLFAESDRGRRFLLGQPDDTQTYEDRYRGAELQPFVYYAVPSGVLLLLSLVSYKADRRRVE